MLKLNLLCSRHYMRKEFALLLDWLRERDRLGEVFIDPGSFSDWRKGKVWPVKRYADWLDRLAVPYDRYIALNVIDDNRQTLANLTWMLYQGYRPVPVYQPGMSWSDILYMYEFSDLVAMGGEPKAGWQAAHERALLDDWPQTKTRDVHLLGLSDTRVLRRLRPYSADASSWAAGLRFGHLKSYRPGAFEMGSKVRRGEEPNEALLAFLEAIGVERDDLSPGAWEQRGGVSLVGLITLTAHLCFAYDLWLNRQSRLFLSFGAALYPLLTHPFDVLGRLDRLAPLFPTQP